MSKSGSPMMLSLSSASMSSILMSADESLERCDISVSVLVRSTTESRPSSADKSKIERCFMPSPRGAREETGDSISGRCGALRLRPGEFGPK